MSKPKAAAAATAGVPAAAGYVDVEYLVLDVSHLAHKHAHALERFATKDKRRSGHVYGCFKHLRALVTQYVPKRLVFAYDRGAPWRQALVPEYKTNRKAGGIGDGISPPALGVFDVPVSQPEHWTPAPDVERLFRGMPGVHLVHDGFEADDVAAWFVRSCPLEGAPPGLPGRRGAIVLFTADRDYWQLVDDQARVAVMIQKKERNKNTNVWIEEPQVGEAFGVPPLGIARFKALLGDDSDNVAGLQGASRPGKKSALRTFLQSTAADLYFSDAAVPPPLPDVPDWLRGELAVQRDRMRANLAVTDLRSSAARVPEAALRLEPGNLAAVMDVLVEFQCESLLAQAAPLFAAITRNASMPRVFG